jgi:cytochrome P450
MTELAEREVDSWPREQPLTLHPRLQQLTLEIILRAVFGLEQGQRLDALRDALTEVLAFSENPLSVVAVPERLRPWIGSIKRYEQASARVDALVFDLIDERRAAGDGGARDDILTLLLGARHEDGSPMSPQELRDELMTALVAGHETTASQLAWAFEQLAWAPQTAERVAVDDDYLTATINEILRHRPVLPNAEPRLTKQPVTIGGFEYPAGVALLASAFLVHHDPDIYPEPYAFRPERFLGKTPGTYTWLPFGGGRRRCLGASFALQEMKIVIRAVVERYELRPATDARETTARRSITFSPSGGATVVLSEKLVDRLAPGQLERPGAEAALAGTAGA